MIRRILACCVMLTLAACTTQPPTPNTPLPPPSNTTAPATTPVSTEPDSTESEIDTLPDPPTDPLALDRLGVVLGEADDAGKAVIKLRFAAIIRKAHYTDGRLFLTIDKAKVNPSGDPQEPKIINTKKKLEQVDYLYPLVLTSQGYPKSIDPAALQDYLPPTSGDYPAAFRFYQSKNVTIIAEIYQG